MDIVGHHQQFNYGIEKDSTCISNFRTTGSCGKALFVVVFLILCVPACFVILVRVVSVVHIIWRPKRGRLCVCWVFLSDI